MTRCATTILSLAITCAVSAAPLELARTFSDGMVLQRNQPILVWGTAEPGHTVEISFKGEQAAVEVTVDGSWQVEFKARPASAESAKLVVQSGEQKTIVNDVLIGDVWFCAGQSNMGMRVTSADGKEKAGKSPHDKYIRFLSLSRGPYTKPITDKVYAKLRPTPENKRNYYAISDWRSCTPANVGKLSAVAYWFAHALQPEIGVPIGLIVPPVGGSAAQAWVSRASIEADPEFRPLLKRWIQDEPERLQKQLIPWLEAHPGATFDDTPMHRHRPTTLYETAVAPMRRHAIKGVIWYQGEQNAQNALQAKWFAKSYPALVADFRRNWGQPELPFYSVQLPGFGNAEWPVFRELQRQFAKIPNTGLAVTIDLGSEKNIHPKDKPPIGRRLALLALAGTYGKDIVGEAPSPDHVSATDNVVSLRFRSVGDGLRADPDERVPGFELAGADGVFKPATARIVAADTFEVRAAGVTVPRQVRYAWAGFPRPLTLANSAGLPAGPFVEAVAK
jgi:sialate O-acetylesterase